MKSLLLPLVFAAASAAAHLPGPTSAADRAPAAPPPRAVDPLANPNIDFNGFVLLAREAQKHRETRRLSEADFLRKSREGGAIVLDARSKEKYDLLHVKGAVNLSFPDIDVDSLQRVLPDKGATILIYCNNNFVNGGPAGGAGAKFGGKDVASRAAMAALAFPSKAPRASLNISTYTALYGYGYRNVYELAPTVDPATTALPLVSGAR